MDKREFTVRLDHLKRNWYFPLSAAAYFCLQASRTVAFALGLVLAVAAAFWIAVCVPSVSARVSKAGMVWKGLALTATVGICWWGQEFFYSDWSHSSVALALNEALSGRVDAARVIGVAGALAASAFVYLAVLYMWTTLCGFFSELGTFRGIRKREWAVYALLLLAILGFMAYSFASSEAFYGTAHNYDILYTSDSPYLVRGNVYLSLFHQENDLRQPLFAVFSAPFAGIAWLAGRLFAASETLRAILTNSVQIVLLLVMQLMLARMLRLDAAGRVSFVLLSSCTYAPLLFSLMMEQYLYACFWLILCVYGIAEKGRAERLALWGAGGTLLTSAVLLPAMSEKSPFRELKGWVLDMLRYGLEFAGLILAFCRTDILFGLYAKLSYFGSFTGKAVTMGDKLRQYTAFVSGIFAAPDAGVNTEFVDYISWQLREANTVSAAGVILLLLVCLSAVWNREKRSSRLAILWVGFSAVMLLGLGWGTQENGLILYALYFGWAFLLLLWQLAEKLGEALGWKVFAPVCALGAAAVLAAINIPAVWDMVSFAITYYPA